MQSRFSRVAAYQNTYFSPRDSGTGMYEPMHELRPCRIEHTRSRTRGRMASPDLASRADKPHPRSDAPAASSQPRWAAMSVLRSSQKSYRQCLSGLSFGIGRRRRGRPEIGIVTGRRVADATCRRVPAIARVVRVSIRRVALWPLARICRFARAGERDREIVGSAAGIRAIVRRPGRRRAILGNHAYVVPDATAQTGGIANPI
jgi:hypothetical protein